MKDDRQPGQYKRPMKESASPESRSEPMSERGEIAPALGEAGQREELTWEECGGYIPAGSGHNADALEAAYKRIAELEAQLLDWMRRSESCESKLGQLEANEELIYARDHIKRLESELLSAQATIERMREVLKSARLALVEANDIIDDTWDCTRTIAAIDSASTPSDTAALDELRRVAYEKGWIRCAKWAGEEHLIADIGSSAYNDDRDADLAIAKKGGKKE